MTHTRHIWALPALALTLVLAACSTPEDLTAPTLEPQFGTSDDDRGLDVFLSDGRVSVLSEETGYHYDEYDQWYDYGYDSLNLRLYDTSGNFISSTFVDGVECGDSYGYGGCGGDRLYPHGLYADSKGFRYVLYSIADHNDHYANYYITKLNTSGSKFTYSLGRGHYYPGKIIVSAAVDSSGSIYVAKVEYAHNYDTGTGTYTNVVAKYSTSGTLQWQRTSTVGTPYSITVSSSGSVYVVGTTGVARYTNSGGLTWSKAASNSKGILEDAGNIVISGSSLYTRSGKDIRKYDSTGKQLWLRTQSSTLVLKDVAGDSSGNIYISGKYQASTSNTNAFVRKVSPSGSILWTKTFGTPAYDEARAATTLSGSEIYVTGLTQGSLAHTNIGGSDGYVRKLNSSGNPIWTR